MKHLSFIISVIIASLMSQGCTSTLPEQHLATLSDTTVKKAKIYLISSSSQYDENIIGEIDKVFSQQGYLIDTSYLKQQPTPLGYVNTDEVRARTLVKALTDNQVKYLWFVRGGSGAFNLYPWLYANKGKISASSPKIIFGFSDVTAIHYFINNEMKWPSIHGVLASYNKEMYALNSEEKISMASSINQAFDTLQTGVSYNNIEPLNRAAAKGVNGILRGGNLTLVQSLFSTRYENSYADNVMILEDTGVTYKQLDRTLHQLEYSKKFHPKAVIFGQFYSIDAAQNEKDLFGYVIQQFASRVDYPVYYYPNFGHGKINQPFILSQPVNILCNNSSSYCHLTQSPVAL